MQTLSPKIGRRRLRHIVSDEPDTLRAAVASEALDYDSDNPNQLFIDLQSCGCVGGTVSSLIYYTDTNTFFDKHFAEIEELRKEYEDSTGEPIRINGDLKNFFAWFAFEETACRMALDDLGLDI